MSANRPAHRVASRLVLAALSVAASVAFFAPPEAGAERGITAGIAAPEYQSLDGGSRDLWFNRTVEGNAELVRIDVVWNRVVGSQRPADHAIPPTRLMTSRAWTPRCERPSSVG